MTPAELKAWAQEVWQEPGITSTDRASRRNRFIEGKGGRPAIVPGTESKPSRIMHLTNLRQKTNEINDRPATKSGWDGVWIGDCPEAERLQRADRLNCSVREIHERWDNRLVLEQVSFGEEYICGRLAVACYLEARRGVGNGVQDSALADLKGHVHNPVMVAVFCMDAGQTLDGNDGNQELMLVDVVKLANFPNRKLASLVRLYFVEDEFPEIGQGALYRSETAGGYKVLPFGPYRKRDSIVVFPDEVGCDVIKRAPEIMNGVPDSKRHCRWRVGKRNQLEDIMSVLRVTLYDKFAEVRLVEGHQDRVKLLDVALGPLDL